MTSIQKQANRMSARLAWQRPMALWLLPLIFLFLTSSLPLLAGGGIWLSTLTVSLAGMTSLVMAIILAHHFFGFVHQMDKNDFYLSLPTSRSKLFWTLNISALSYLIGPSLAIMILNTILVLFSGQSLSPAIPYDSPLPSLWLSYAGLVLQLIYLFLLLELFYLVTDRVSRALGSFLLVNLFWPLLLFLYADASCRFLPGLINPLTTSSQPSLWLVGLLQLFSPIFFFLGDLENYHLLTGLMAIGLAGLTYLAFRKRKPDYQAGGSAISWPFELTQWMGIMSLTLLGGYGAHYLRELTSEPPDLEGKLSPGSPLPFLIGSLLGLLLSLWIFNLIKGKGRLVWRAFPASLAITVIPFVAWLALVMSGAGGFSTKLPQAQAMDRVSLYYSEGYRPPYPSRLGGDFSLDLTEPQDLVHFTRLYDQVLTADNPGLALPRTLSSRELSTDFARRLDPALPLNKNNPDSRGYYYSWHPETRFTLLGKDGRTYQRLMLLPQSYWHEDYLALLKGNRSFYLAELSQYTVSGKLRINYSLQATDQASAQDRESWIDPLKALAEDESVFFAGSGLEEMAGWIARSLVLASDETFDQMQKTAPALIRVRLDLSDIKGSDPADYQLLLPLDPDRIPGLKAIMDNYLDFYEEMERERFYKDEKGERLP